MSKIRTKPLERMLILFAVFFVILSGFFTYGKTQNTYYEVQTFNKGWYYIQDDHPIYIELPITIETNDLTIYKDVSSQFKNQTVSTHGIQYDIEAYVSNVLVYSVKEDSFKKNRQLKEVLICDFPLGVIEDEVQLSIHLTSDNNHIDIPEMIIGSSESILRYHYYNSVLDLIFIAILFVIFGICLTAFNIIQKENRSVKKMFYLSAFIFLAAVWMLTDMPLFLQVSNNLGLMLFIQFSSFMALPIPMCHFINEILGKEHRLINILNVLFYFNILIQNVMNLLFGIPFIDMLFISHILAASLIFVSLYTLYQSENFKTDKYTRALFGGIFVLSLFCLVAVISYYFNTKIYRTSFALGIISLIISFIYVVLDETVNKYREFTKKEISDKMQIIDNLSGLKNRRSYEEQIRLFYQNVDQYDNILLIFFDIVNLKEVNDQYGHKAGDELVLYVSKCIERAFNFTNYCYRIGGNEFCVMITDPKENANYYNQLLLDETRANPNCETVLVKGSSLLKDENGEVKLASDWKRQADNELYHERKKLHVR